MKKLASLFLVLAMCMGLAVPAFAVEEKTVYLAVREARQLEDGDVDYITAETANAGAAAFSLTGKGLETIGQLTLSGEIASMKGPIYYSPAPVTVKLIEGTIKADDKLSGSDNGTPFSKLATYPVINTFSYDAEKRYYSIQEYNAVSFQGSVALEDLETGRPVYLGTIEELDAGKFSDLISGPDDRVFYYEGAYATLSEPGIYHVQVGYEALAKSCFATIWVGMKPGAFSDVPSDAYYADAVKWAVDQGITTGTTASTFSPKDTCTRAQILTFLWRAAGSPEPESLSAFPDVKADAYYAKAAAWAKENGMVSGDAFAPNDPCTRLMAVEFMWKQAGSPSAEKAGFTDVTSDAVNWAVEKEITTGTSETTFSPKDTCTRAQIATLLYRAFAE